MKDLDELKRLPPKGIPLTIREQEMVKAALPDLIAEIERLQKHAEFCDRLQTRHDRYVLETSGRIERLEAALREIASEDDWDRENMSSAASSMIRLARAALESEK